MTPSGSTTPSGFQSLTQTWKTYNTGNGLAGNTVKKIAIDAAGNKWFATDGGVSKFNGTIWTTYTEKDGLASNYVNAIAIDAQGRKWFGTAMAPRFSTTPP